MSSFLPILQRCLPTRFLSKVCGSCSQYRAALSFVLSSFVDVMDKWILCSSCISLPHIYLSSSFVKLLAQQIPPSTRKITIQSTLNITVLHPFKMVFLNIAKIANAVPITLYSRVPICKYYYCCSQLSEIQSVPQVSGHKSLGLLFEGVMVMSW